jgi:hypothetical protein
MVPWSLVNPVKLVPTLPGGDMGETPIRSSPRQRSNRKGPAGAGNLLVIAPRTRHRALSKKKPRSPRSKRRAFRRSLPPQPTTTVDSS